jgi:surfactin synthase thioesterase subunit
MAACLPGRRERYDEAPRHSVDPMAGEIADAICALPEMPTTLFGHSFGGILAYEVAQQIERRVPGQLGALVVSACARSAATALDGVDETDEAAVLEAFIKRGYLAPEHVKNNKLMELVLPYLLGDVLCKKRWQSDTWPPLRTPIHTLVWTDDQLVHPTSVQNWHAFSARPKSCRHFEFPGAHLEYLSQPLPMFDALNGILDHVLSEPGDPETLSKEAQRYVG